MATCRCPTQCISHRVGNSSIMCPTLQIIIIIIIWTHHLCFFWHMSITHRCLTWCISVSLCRRLSYCTKPKNNLDKPPDVSNMSSNDMIYLLVCRQCIGSISNCTKPNNWFDMPSGVSNTCQCWGMYLLDLGGVSVHPRSLLYWV